MTSLDKIRPLIPGLTGPYTPDQFLGELRLRNAGVLNPREQALVSSARVVVAGCGSVGGSVVEPLTRLGVGALVLTDPDVYDVTNLNRQAAFVKDIGRNKAQVQAERAEAINPYVDTVVYPDGVTAENVAEIVEGASIIFDAVDIAEGGLYWKFLVHKEAARRRIPVISGIDLSGKSTVFVFDYRKDPTPFYGKCSEEAFRHATEVGSGTGEGARAVRGWITLDKMPAEFLVMGRDVLTTGIAWPQVCYAITGIGAIASRVIIELLSNRPVRYFVATDFHDLPRRPLTRRGARARWVAEAFNTLRFFKNPPPRRTQVVDPRAGLEGWPHDVLSVADAIRRAPSVYNTQPWQLRLKNDHEIEISWATDRLPYTVDPERRLALAALGTAVEAAATVAEVDIEYPANQSDNGAVVSLIVDRLREDTYLKSSALLAARATNRYPFSDASPPADTLDQLTRAAELHGVNAAVLLDRRRLDSLGHLTDRVLGRSLAERASRGETARWLRSRSEIDHTPTGLTAEALGVSERSLNRIRRSAQAWTAPRARRDAAPLRAHRRLFLDSGAALALAAPPGRVDELRIGRAIMAVWLAATRAGLAVHPLSWSSLEEPAVHAVRETFGLTADLNLVLLFRLGYGTRIAPQSPRLPLASVCAPADGTNRSASSER